MIDTERLILRRWRDDDHERYANLRADPEVAHWLGGNPPREVVLVSVQRFNSDLDKNGMGLLAIERRVDALLVGAAGLSHVGLDNPLAGSVEIGWRLARHAWGFGYASEAASALLVHGFERHRLSEIVAFTVVSNMRSRAVMERIGMKREAARDFDHPALAADHPLRRHVVYVATAR